MNDDGLDALRAAVADHAGPARARPLTELGQALAQRYWQVGPGSPAAQPHLDEAIAVLEEAYGYLEPGEFPRGMQAGMLGWLLGIRHVAHGGPVDDRERGIALLDEALGFPQLAPMMALLARVVLGQLLLSRVTRSMQAPDFMMRAMVSGLGTEEKASADRAVACFREVVDAPVASAELTAMARMLLGLAEALQTMAGGLGHGPGGLDLGRMMTALSSLQTLQQQATGSGTGAFGPGQMPNLFALAADDLAAADPLDRPVTVVKGAAPPQPPAPADRPAAVPREPAATFRTGFFAALGGTERTALLTALDAGAGLGVGTVDQLVALAGATVDAPDAVDTDHLLLALALHLRSVTDAGGGWGDDGGDVGDVRAASESLLAAAGAVAADAADAVVVASRLAAALDARQPARRVRARFAGAFTGVAAALRAVGADGLLYRAAGDALLLCADSGDLVAAPVTLPPRLLVADDAPAPDGPTVSVVRSGAQLVALADRPRRPLAEAPVFVANPRDDRPAVSRDVLLLRRRFYPGSTGLGRTGAAADGDGTPDDVRRRLDASLLHLGCGVTAGGGLELAGPAVLDTAAIAAGPPAQRGGLAVVPSTPHGADALTDALLASHFTGVVRFRHPVPDDVASITQLVLHAELVDGRRDPAGAVAAVRRWLADPARTAPEYLSPWLEARAADPDLADPAYVDALVHHGV